MKNRASIGLLIALVATAAAAPSWGQVYKWVDSNGRVNYSSQPPADAASSKSLKVVEANVSVYTPDDSLKRAVEENRQRKNSQAASDHVYAVAARPTCADSGMIPSPQGGCQAVDNGLSDYYPYAPAVVYGRFRRHPVQLAQAQIPPGTIAGNVVGMNGYTPGLSAQAASMAPPPPARPPRVSPAGRGLPLR
jgi:uncharacterized protein DUF4124